MALLCSALLFAQQETAQFNDINYQLNPSDGTASVAPTPNVSGELLLPEEITVGQKTYKVTEIGDKAFKGCKKLTSVVLPQTLEHIYRSAFDGTGVMNDKSLWADGALIIDDCLIATNKSIKAKYAVPESVRLIAAGAFENNKTVTNVVLHDGLTKIDHDTFRGCKNLNKVNIPASVTWIGEDAFTDCGIYANEKKWKRGSLFIDRCLIRVNDAAPAKYVFKTKEPTRLIASAAFAGTQKMKIKVKTITIPEGIEEIPTAAFYHCENLQEVNLPSSLKKIGMYAFYGCDKLKAVNMPEGLEELGAGAFYGCVNLPEVKLPATISVIPKACFFTCRKFTAFNFPAGLKRIEDGAFTGCTELEKIDLPENLEELGEMAFAGCAKLTKVVIPARVNTIRRGAFRDCTHLLNVQFPDGLYAIDDEAFTGCLQIEKLAFPKELFRIGQRAFAECQNLEKVSFCERLNAIETEAFKNCIQLHDLNMSDQLEVLGNNAFEKCINLRTVIFGARLEKIGDYVFAGCRSLQEVKMPKMLKEIGVGAFAECKYLSKVIWAEHLELEYIDDEAFLNCERLEVPELDEYVDYGKNVFKGCKEPAE